MKNRVGVNDEGDQLAENNEACSSHSQEALIAALLLVGVDP
jgi:hypothetical protein